MYQLTLWEDFPKHTDQSGPLTGFGLSISDRKKLIRQGWLLVLADANTQTIETSRGVDERFTYKSKAEMHRKAEPYKSQPRTILSFSGNIHASEIAKLMEEGYTVIRLASNETIKAKQKNLQGWKNIYRTGVDGKKSALAQFEEMSKDEFTIVH